jgi:D-threo-aldose 1-dehydrogenase
MIGRRPVGDSAIAVTELGFGAAPIGNLYRAISDAQAAATVEAAWEHGIRYFDTAPHYGLGLAERRLGAVLRHCPRDDFVISTKVGRLLVPNSGRTGSDLAAGFDTADELTRIRDYSADGVRRSLEQSLERLGLDRVDIALVHDPEDHLQQAAEEAIPALCELRDAGMISLVGLGMNYVDPLEWFVTRPWPDGVGPDVVLVAGRWTLLDRTAGPLLDACADHGVAVISAAPFNTGLLARARPTEGGYFNYRAATPEVLQRARDFAAAASGQGIELPGAAVRFPLRHPAVVSVLAGMQTPEEAGTNAMLINTEISVDGWRALDAVPPLLT